MTKGETDPIDIDSLEQAFHTNTTIRLLNVLPSLVAEIRRLRALLAATPAECEHGNEWDDCKVCSVAGSNGHDTSGVPRWLEEKDFASCAEDLTDERLLWVLEAFATCKPYFEPHAVERREMAREILRLRTALSSALRERDEAIASLIRVGREEDLAMERGLRVMAEKERDEAATKHAALCRYAVARFGKDDPEADDDDAREAIKHNDSDPCGACRARAALEGKTP